MNNSIAEKSDETLGAVWKKIIILSLPLIFGQLLHQIYHAVDGIVVGHYVSQNALAAVGACMPLTMLFYAFAMGLSAGGGIMMTRYYGSKKYDYLRKTFSSSLIILSGLGVLMTLLAVSGARFLVTTVLNIQNPEIRELAITYFRISALGIWAIFLYDCVFSMLRSVGDSRAVLYLMSFSAVINLALDIIFVVPLGLGVAGAAAATVLTNVVCVASSLIYMQKKYPLLRFSVRKLKVDISNARMILRMDLPAVFQMVIMAVGTLFVHRVVNSFGEHTIAAFTVGSRVDGLLFCTVFGFNHVVSHLTGENIEEGKIDKVRHIWAHGLLLTGIVSGISCLIVFMFAEPMALLFGISGEALHQSVEFIEHNCMFFVVFAINGITLSVMHGADDVIFTTATLIISFAVRVVGTYIFAYRTEMGHESLWFTIPLGWAVSMLLAHIRYFSGAWKRNASTLLANHHNSDHIASFESLEDLEEHFYE